MDDIVIRRSGFRNIFARIKENRWIPRILPIVLLASISALFFFLTEGNFLSPRNLKTIVDQALVVGTVATGAAFIFGTGNVNIAMGACTALTATIAALVYLQTGSLPLMFITAIVFGVILLYICAVLSTVFRVRVMFVTIIMMVLLSSVKDVILGGSTLALPFEIMSGLQQAYVPYIIFFIFFALCGVLFHWTRVGRMIKLIGSNRTCAELTGIKYNRVLILAFLVAGVGVGLGALLTIIRTSSITVSTLSSLNMDCMLAIVLGGMPVFGGSKSRSYAAILGAVTVTVLNSGLLMVGVSSTMLQGVRGVIFIILVLMGQKRSETLPTREG